jgi:hypothetical protein
MYHNPEIFEINASKPIKSQKKSCSFFGTICLQQGTSSFSHTHLPLAQLAESAADCRLAVHLLGFRFTHLQIRPVTAPLREDYKEQ